MNKRIKVLFMFILAFIIMIGFNNKAFAAKWSDLSQSQRSEIFKYADTANESEIVEVCKYELKGANESEDIFVKYLFIYIDDTATIGWHSSSETRLTNEKSKGVEKKEAIDGYEKNTNSQYPYRGVRNWSANKGKNSGRDGVVNNLGFKDAYKVYKDTGACPSFMGEHNNYASHSFWLSTGYALSDYKNLIKWTESDTNEFGGSDNDYYLNIALNDSDIPNIDSNLTCEYAQNDDSEEKIVFSFSFESGHNLKSLVKGTFKSGTGNELTIKNVTANTSMNSIPFLEQVENDKCPQTIIGCAIPADTDASMSRPGAGAANNIHNYTLEITGDESINDQFCTGAFSKYYFKCIGENCSTKGICKATSDIYNKMDSSLKSYSDAKKNNSSLKNQYLNDYNSYRDQYNAFCTSTLSQKDYVEGTCLDECIIVSEKIADLEKTYGLRTSYGKEKCNIGEQVLSMVYNVLKWAKYIAPVLVIILSILDFIKAIAAQSDDEMKKAQGKFVKRLIVAALLFLLPLIINFALKTFGFYNAGCDITDLF